MFLFIKREKSILFKFCDIIGIVQKVLPMLSYQGNNLQVAILFSLEDRNDDNFSEVEEGITPIPSGEIDGKRNYDKYDV